MKTINTLVQDMYEQIRQGVQWDPIQIPPNEDRIPSLRLSQLGPRCPRALWHSIHKPEEAEQLPSWALFKYSYGHVLEAMAIQLAKKAGHTVEGEQDELVVDGIKGHRDCVIDGCMVDVKSTTSIGFIKFKDGSLHQSDSFGYLDQLDAYMVGSSNDPIVTNKDRGYILAIDKNLGHMVLYEHAMREAHIRSRIAEFKQIISLPNPPDCTCGTREHGKSGNIQLDTKASYNIYKHTCFPHLRTFLYADGPVYLTQVKRKPDVIEIDRFGKVIYN